MDKLPCDIINNILLIQQKEYLKQIDILKKKCRSLQFNLEETQQSNCNMLNYLEVHEVKYCEVCDCYGTDDEIILYDNFNEYLCEYCLEFREENE
jgi:hypothetical protein